MINRYFALMSTVIIASGCVQKNSESASSASSSPTTEDTGPGSDSQEQDPESIQAGKLALIKIAVSAVAAQGTFLTVQTEANSASSAAAGNLALGSALGLTAKELDGSAPTPLALTTATYRTPVRPSFSIASGAPDEMVIYVRRIVLEKKDLQSSGGETSLPPSPYSVKESHIDLLPENSRERAKSLLGITYDDIDGLLQALAGAGVDEDTAQGIFGARMHELQASWVPTDGDSANQSPIAVIFEDEAGKPIKISNGVVDLGALAADAQSGVANFQVPEGEYNTLSITYANKAQVKGCVRMLYECRRSPTERSCDTDLPTDDIPGNKDVAANTSLPGSPRQSLLTYCTQTDKSLYQNAVVTQNSDFINKDPELMDFALSMSDANGWRDDSRTINASYHLPDLVKVKDGTETPQITLLVDLNRMLRYYNRGRLDQGPNPDLPKDRSYFFSSIFLESTYAFLGAPGRIYGFEMQANACLVESNDQSETLQGPFDTATGKCQNNTTPNGQVPFWMTIVTAANGAPIYAITSPDDDNDLTITKGNVRAWSECPGNEPIKKWVEAEPDTNPLTVAIRYGLCDHTTAQMGPNGIYKHFPANLESIEIMPPETALGDGNVDGVMIETTAKKPESDKYTIYKGPITVGRRL